MRVFTSGKLTVLRTPSHIIRWPRGEDATIEPVGKGPVRGTEAFHDGLLLHAPSGKDLSGPFEEVLSAKPSVLDAEVLDEEQIAILHADQRLTWGPPPAEGKWAMEAELASQQGELPRWASKVRLHRRGARKDLDEEERAYEEELFSKRGTGFPRGSLLANSHGIGVVSSASGNVALFRPTEAEPALLLRLDAADEDRLYARPTKVGLLITAVFNGRHTVVFHVGADGKLRTRRKETAHGGPPAIHLGRRILDFEGDVAVLRDGRLKAVATLETQVVPVTLAASPKGRHFAFADARGAALVLCEVVKGELREVDRIDYGDLRRQTKAKKDTKAAKAIYEPKGVPGEAAIGFAAKPTVSPPWEVPTGDFDLDLVVRSAGGKGAGLCLRVSGEALSVLALESVSCEGVRVPFEPDGDGVKAELPEVVLCEGLILPVQPAPKGELQKSIAAELLAETHLTLHLRGHGDRAGSELMRVEVSALGAASAPLKWMRPMVVG